MTLPVPNLDDRTFTDLVLAARERVTRSCPEWTDLSVHDPGLALVEVGATNAVLKPRKSSAWMTTA